MTYNVFGAQDVKPYSINLTYLLTYYFNTISAIFKGRILGEFYVFSREPLSL